MKCVKKVPLSAVKAKPSAGKDTGYEKKQKRLKKFKYEERVSSTRLAFERAKVFNQAMAKLNQPCRKYFIFDSDGSKVRVAGGLWASRFLSIQCVLRSSPLSLVLHYCQSNLLCQTRSHNGSDDQMHRWGFG